MKLKNQLLSKINTKNHFPKHFFKMR